MRRKEFEITDKSSINEVLNECEYGTLSLVSDSKPYAVALNFVFFEGSIFFHGSSVGKKIEIIKSNSNGAFLVVKPYSIIPSYFFDTVAACPATQFFASVLLEGNLSFVENIDEKAKILNALMQKLQKEGGYEKIAYDKAIYKKMLDSVAIIKLLPQNISCKIKVGQNLIKERKDILIKHIEKLDTKISKETLQMIKFYED